MAERRPGFNLDTTFRTHLSTVKFVRFNAKHGSFLSCDEKSFKAWTLQPDGSCSLFHDGNFPGYQSNFITALTVSTEPLNLIFAACLDGNLRLYSEKMQLRSCMPWSSGAVRAMVFNSKRNELITAGSYGVKAWSCELDHDAYHNDKAVDPYSIPRTQDGKVIPWGFGRYQHARQRMQFRVPGARALGTGVKQDNSYASVGSTDWCEHVQLHEPTNTLFALLRGSVYGFDADSGVLHMSFTDLHALPITSLVYASDSDTIITATLDDGVTIWRIANGIPHRFTSFGKSVTYMVPDDHDKPSTLLTTSSDGSVTYWSLDGGQPLYRMKLAAQVGGLPVFYEPNRFALHTGCEIRLFSIQCVGETWSECNAAPTRLQALPGSGGLILAEYSDSSIRILDATSHQVDKSIVVVPPQLSSSSLQTAAVSLCCAKLYALLSSGELHVWQVARGRPPQWLAAWPHLMRERCCSVEIIERGSLKPLPRPGKGGAAALNSKLNETSLGVVAALNLNFHAATGAIHEHLVLGCSSGDVLVVDAEQSGAITCRFPAFRQQPVHKVKLRLDGPKPLLLAVARCCLKVWSMEEQLKCLHVLDTSQQICVVELLAGQVLLGTSSGSVHLVDADTGEASAPASSVDHLDQVTGCGPSEHLKHIATCAKDSHIKVFNASKALICSVYLGASPTACCYLNDLGDILVAVQRKLMVVTASVCQVLANDDDSGLPAPPLYAHASPRMHVTRPIHPMLSGVARASATGPSVLEQQPEVTNQQPAQAKTPLPRVGSRTASASADLVTSRPPSQGNGAVVVLEGEGAAKDAVAALPELPSRSSTAKPKSAIKQGQQRGLPSRPSITSSLSTSKSSTPVVPTRAPVSARSIPSQTAGHARKLASRVSVASAHSELSEDVTSDTDSRPAETPPVAISTAAADGKQQGHMTYSVSPEPGQSPHGHRSLDVFGLPKPEQSNLSSDESSQSNDDHDDDSSSGSSMTDEDDEGEDGSDIDSDSSDEIARKAALAQLQKQQWDLLLQHHKTMKLPFQTMFKLDLANEQHKQQRRRFGLQVDPDKPAAPSAQASKVASGVTGALPPSDDEIEASAACWEAVTGGYREEGEHRTDQGVATSGKQDSDALAARFRKLLPLLSSESILLDGPLPPELQALLQPKRGVKQRKKKKEGKKSSSKVKQGQPASQQHLVPAGLQPLQPSTPGSKVGSPASKVGTPASRQCSSRSAQHKLPSLSSMLSGRPMGAALASLPVVVHQPPEPAPEEKKKKKKKKARKGKRRNHQSDLELLDPVKYLASVTRDSSVLTEIQMLNKHQMLTRVRDVGSSHPAPKRAPPAKTTRPPAAGSLQDLGQDGEHDEEEAASAPRLARNNTSLSFKSVLKAVEETWGTPSPAVKGSTRKKQPVKKVSTVQRVDSITDALARANFDF